MYKRIPVRKLRGFEEFTNTPNKKFSVLEFWQYGFSNLNSNVLRGALAEFLVENALKQSSEIDVRSPWGDYDVLYQDIKIEVKCCSYIQDWDQNQFTKILWSGLKATELYYSDAVKKQSELNRVADYKSDVYVLALFKHQEHATLDILDMNQWCFYILTQEQIREVSKDGNSVSLTRLNKRQIEAYSFDNLKKKVESLASTNMAQNIV